MKRCVKCGQERMQAAYAADSIEVAGHTFTASLPTFTCGNCGEALYSAEAVSGFETLVAVTLARAGVNSSDALRFMRKALKMRASDLADLLDVAPETVSRWETGKLPPERRTLALLGSLVMDKWEGRTATLDRLRALREPKPLTQTVQLDLTPA